MTEWSIASDGQNKRKKENEVQGKQEIIKSAI